MNVETAYKKYLLKAEHNGLSRGIATDRGRFALKFNEAYNRLVEYIISVGRSDEINTIQHLLTDDSELTNSISHLDHTDFNLPENYFKYSTVYGIGVCDGVKDKITLFPIKDSQRTTIMSDEFNKPSFIWREAPFSIADNKLKAYKDNFEYEKVYLSYYKYPTQVKLQQPNNPESQFVNIEIEGDDKFIDRVISLAVGEFNIDTQNQMYQINKQRAISKA